MGWSPKPRTPNPRICALNLRLHVVDGMVLGSASNLIKFEDIIARQMVSTPTLLKEKSVYPRYDEERSLNGEARAVEVYYRIAIQEL